MKVRINGELKELSQALSLAELLNQLSIPQKGIAIELNRAVLPKEAWFAKQVEDGDTIEIVQFVGGGAFWFLGKTLYLDRKRYDKTIGDCWITGKSKDDQ